MTTLPAQSLGTRRGKHEFDHPDAMFQVCGVYRDLQGAANTGQCPKMEGMAAMRLRFLELQCALNLLHSLRVPVPIISSRL